MTARPRVLFWVQHLLGIGHLQRAAVLTRALGRAGMDVTLVSGGAPEPGIDVAGAALVQLPPLRAAGGDFRALVDGSGAPAGEGFRARRAGLLLDTLRAAAPDAVVTELFPFGRRQFRDEVLALVGEARAGGSLVVSSVRDILVRPPGPERVRETLELVERHYDRVLVHGDPDLVAFDETFPCAARVADRILYTGYVVDPPAARPGGPGSGEVLVSSGGGAVGERLFRAAIAARPLSALAGRRWRLLVSNSLDDDAFARLSASAGDGVTVERTRRDFTSLLANCAVSISRGGYNTVMEVLSARARTVIVPYAEGHETEQALRARLLDGRDGIRSLPEDRLDAGSLAAAVDGVVAAPPPAPPGIRMDGAEATARILGEWLS